LRCVIVADDLTGAADASVALADRGATVAVLPWTDAMIADLEVELGHASGSRHLVDVLVVETDTRDADAGEAGERLRRVGEVLARMPPPMVAKKIDSVLRGPIAAELAALRDALRPSRTVIAPAFPRLGRTTVAGIQLRDGVPVDVEQGAPAGRRADTADVADACDVPDAMRSAAGDPLPPAAVSVHDATSDADLAALAARIERCDPRPLVVGSAGLLEALAPYLVPRTEEGLGRRHPAAAPSQQRAGWTLIVSLSPTATAIGQVAQLRRERRVHEIMLEPDLVTIEPQAAAALLCHRIRTLLDDGDDIVAEGRTVLVTLVDGARAASDPVEAARTRAALLEACREAFRMLPAPALVVANGGDAARTAVDAWRLGRLDVYGSLPHGSSLVRGSQGTLLALKSGGFGPAGALIELLDAASFHPSDHATGGSSA